MRYVSRANRGMNFEELMKKLEEITTKLESHIKTYDETIAHFEESLRN